MFFSLSNGKVDETDHIFDDSFEQDCLLFCVGVLHVTVDKLTLLEMVQPEKKILWHPTRQSRFIVGGGDPVGQIKVYDWDGKSNISEVTAVGDLHNMKCFALSPHPLEDDLVAVGSSVGNVELLRFSVPHPPNTIRSPSSVSLPIRTPRSCNALAFSQFDPNYMAVGLEKARDNKGRQSEPSLLILDIESFSSSLSKPPYRDQGAFKRPEPFLPLSVPPHKNFIQQWANTESIISLAFLPDTTSLLVAGVGHMWLKLFDLRVSFSPTNPLSTTTKSIHGVSVDPFDSNRIASFGDDGVIRIWDIRRFSSPLLSFTERDAAADGGNVRGFNALSGVEFSRSRRGMLATLEANAVVVRFWDTINATFPEEHEPPNTRPEEEVHSSKISKLARLPWSSSTTEPQLPVTIDKHLTHGEQIVLRNTRTSARFSRPLSSFVWIPGHSSRINEYSVAVVTGDGDLDMQTMYDPPEPRWSSRGELSISSGRSYQIYQPFRDDEPFAEPWTIATPEPLSYKSSPYGSVRGRKAVLKDPLSLVSGGIELSLHPSRTYSPASMRRFTPNKSPAPDATPRPGQVALRPDIELLEKRGRIFQRGEQKTFSRSLSRSKLSSDERSSRRIITDDISMVIRRRVLKGYGFENIMHNAEVARSDTVLPDTLYELWMWIYSSRNLLSYGDSRIHGFEFANQGVLGIWEGLQPIPRTPSLDCAPTLEFQKGHELDMSLLSLPDEDGDGYRTPSRRRRRTSLRRSHSPIDQLHGDFAAAVHTLNIRRGYDRSSVAKISISTSRLAQRRFCLSLCGWNQGEDELLRAAATWEREGQLTRAACWLLFTDHHEKAIECLMRSEDERLRIMSGTIAALIPQKGTSTRLREHYNRLIVRIEDPYLRVMLTHIALEDWSEILQEESLPLRERLAIAFRFLDDRALSSYLRQLAERFRLDGDIEGLIVTGITPIGIDVLQGYVDITGDVQTASILGAFVCPATFKDPRVERWFEAYRLLLDGWKLFHHRCQFDISRGEVIKEAVTKAEIDPFDWVAPQLAIKCGFCNKAINARTPMAGPGGRTRVNCCQTCGRSLPRCSICLTTLGLAFDSARDTELAEGPESKDTIDYAMVFCQTCKHGGHISHLLEWFRGSNQEKESERQSHEECPVANCDCRCEYEVIM